MALVPLIVLVGVWIWAIFICCPNNVFALYCRLWSSRTRWNKHDGCAYQWYQMLTPKAANSTTIVWYGIQHYTRPAFIVGKAKGDEKYTCCFFMTGDTRLDQETVLEKDIIPFLEQYVVKAQVDDVRAAATDFINEWYPIPSDTTDIDHGKIYQRSA